MLKEVNVIIGNEFIVFWKGVFRIMLAFRKGRGLKSKETLLANSKVST